jgi:hypothetical protein
MINMNREQRMIEDMNARIAETDRLINLCDEDDNQGREMYGHYADGLHDALKLFLHIYNIKEQGNV